MKLTKDQVAAVVTEASQKMSDPNYSAVMVGGFVQSQTPVAQFISAHERELGGAEAIVNVIFHCALVAQCYHHGIGRFAHRLYSTTERRRHAIGEVGRMRRANGQVGNGRLHCLRFRAGDDEDLADCGIDRSLHRGSNDGRLINSRKQLVCA